MSMHADNTAQHADSVYAPSVLYPPHESLHLRCGGEGNTLTGRPTQYFVVTEGVASWAPGGLLLLPVPVLLSGTLPLSVKLLLVLLLPRLFLQRACSNNQ